MTLVLMDRTDVKPFTFMGPQGEKKEAVLYNEEYIWLMTKYRG